LGRDHYRRAVNPAHGGRHALTSDGRDLLMPAPKQILWIAAISAAVMLGLNHFQAKAAGGASGASKRYGA
jgi:hypothetical protein